MGLWQKDNPTPYNEWRKKYRARMHAKGRCRSCYKPLLEGASTDNYCIVCVESGLQRKALNRSLQIP